MLVVALVLSRCFLGFEEMACAMEHPHCVNFYLKVFNNEGHGESGV